MTVKVKTYNNPQKFREHHSYDEIKNEIHICATKNVAEGLRERYYVEESEEFRYIFTIHQIIQKVFNNWYEPETIMEHYLTLSRIINYEDGKRELREAFRKNASEVLDTIRMLVFSGLEPNDLLVLEDKKDNQGHDILTEKEKLFRRVWNSLEKNYSMFSEMRNLLKGTWKIQGIQKRLKIPKQKQTIVLHGFYFITVEQQVFLKLLQRAGFNIVFFQFYDDRFPNTFNFSKSFISQKYGWTDSWEIQRNKNAKETIGSAFLLTFEEGEQKVFKQDKKVLAYDSYFDFLHHVIMQHYPIGEEKQREITDDNNNVEIIATNADILNELLVQYYPEKFAEKRNFLNYPVGQFILKIHEIRNNNTLIYNPDILMACFSSGWLMDKTSNENARNYTSDLEKLLPYFNRCRTVDEWIDRINKLLSQYNLMLPLFERDSDNRVLESIRSPFTRIAHYSMDKKRIEQIKNFFLLLKSMTEDLFDMDNEETSIHVHFQRLSVLMKQHNPITNKVLLQSEEKELIEKLQHKIVRINDKHQFLYEDIGDAIQFYLSGKFSKDEEDRFIKPFIEVDGEAFKTGNRKIYLTGLDEQGLPLGKFTTPWPLQEETFKTLSTKHQVLELHELRNKSVKAISRYLLFITLEFLWDKQIELSWMRNFLDRENLQPAIYIQYLQMGTVDYSIEMNTEKETPYNQYDFGSLETHTELIQNSLKELEFEDILAEYELCPRRFYFGYILDRYPTYNNEFIHQFIFTEIVKIVKRSTKQDNRTVIDMVSEIFPQWTHFDKEEMATRSLIYAGNGKGTLDKIDKDVKVRAERKNIQLPGLKNDVRNKLYENVDSNKEQIINEILEFDSQPVMMRANPNNHCRFCPFLDLCPEGQYALDKEVSAK